MSITPVTANLDIIAALDDEPNDVTGLTAAQLKAKFDEGPNALKTYINGTLLSDLRAENIPFTPTLGVPGVSDIQSAVESVQAQISGVALGAIPDGTIVPSKLDAMLQESVFSAAHVFKATATLNSASWSGG